MILSEGPYHLSQAAVAVELVTQLFRLLSLWYPKPWRKNFLNY